METASLPVSGCPVFGKEEGGACTGLAAKQLGGWEWHARMSRVPASAQGSLGQCPHSGEVLVGSGVHCGEQDVACHPEAQLWVPVPALGLFTPKVLPLPSRGQAGRGQDWAQGARCT